MAIFLGQPHNYSILESASQLDSWLVDSNHLSSPSCMCVHIYIYTYIYIYKYLELPNTGFLTPNPKKIDFGGWCGKKNTGVVLAVRDTSDVLEWKKAFKKR